MEFYETIQRDLIEILSKSFTFKDLETIGRDIFGEYSTHQLEKTNPTVSIAPANAARRLVVECMERKKLEMLINTLMQLDGSYLNDRVVKLFHIENFLYNLTLHGIIYDFEKRKMVELKKDRSLLPNWGSLRDGKNYDLTVASIDIVGNSKLVRAHGTHTMEKVYHLLLSFIRSKLATCEGRVWSWQGDGGLIAFPKGQDPTLSVSCCLEILLTLPIYNFHPGKSIKDDVILRIGMDHGPVKFFMNTGRIVSETINYAAHLEKSGTESWGLSVSDSIHAKMTDKLQKIFSHKNMFEGRQAYSLTISSDWRK